MIYGETTPVPEPTLTIHGRTAGALTSMPFFFLRRVSHAARHEWVCGRHAPCSSSSRWRRVLRRARVPPFLKKVDGIVKGHHFPDPVLSPLQLNRSCKHSRVHLTLTEYDGVQQERRCGRASRRFVAFGSLAQEVASDLGCSPSKRGMVRLPRTVQILQRAPVTRRAAGIAEDSQEIASGLLIPDASNRLRLALAREPSLSADVSLLPAEQILLPA